MNSRRAVHLLGRREGARHIAVRLLGAGLLLGVAACGGGGGGDNGASDTVPPFVTSTIPPNNASDVPIDSVIAVTFSEAVDPATVIPTSMTVRSGFNTRAGSLVYSAGTATFTPNAELDYGVMYTVHVTPGIADAAGNQLPVDYFWTFTTAPPPDTTPPSVVQTIPFDGATSVALGSAVRVRFSEPIDPTTLREDTFVVSLEGGASLQGAVSYDPDSVTATFTPQDPLLNNQRYSAVVTTDVADTSGNHLAAPYAWSFTAEPFPDHTPPNVVHTTPAADDKRVPLGAVVSATFDEAMAAGSLNSGTFVVTPVGGSPLAGSIVYDAEHFIATFTPASPFVSGTTYTVRLTTGVTDAATTPNPLVAEYQWSFAIIAPRFAFVANSESDDVSVFSVNPSTGALALQNVVPAGDGPRSLGVDPTGQFVYVANQQDNTVTAFSFDAASASLTQVGLALAGAKPSSLAIDPSGRFVYVTNMNSTNVSVFGIGATGALTNPSPVQAGALPAWIAVHPSGRFAYVANQGADVERFQLDQQTGVLRDGQSVPANRQPVSVAVEPSGRFAYVANRFSGDVTSFRIDENSGILSEIGTEVRVGSSPVAIAADPSGRFVYVVNRSSGTVSMFRIDPSTGQLQVIAPGTVPPGANPTFVAVDPSGQFAYIAHAGPRSAGDASNVTIYRIDQSTGALTEVGTATAGLGPLAIAILGSTN